LNLSAYGSCLPLTGITGAPLRLSAFGDPDDRLAGGAPVGGERSRRFGERPYCPDDRLEPSIPEPLGEVRQPGTVGFDDEEGSAPVLGLDRGLRQQLPSHFRPWHGTLVEKLLPSSPSQPPYHSVVKDYGRNRPCRLFQAR